MTTTADNKNATDNLQQIVGFLSTLSAESLSLLCLCNTDILQLGDCCREYETTADDWRDCLTSFSTTSSSSGGGGSRTTDPTANVDHKTTLDNIIKMFTQASAEDTEGDYTTSHDDDGIVEADCSPQTVPVGTTLAMNMMMSVMELLPDTSASSSSARHVHHRNHLQCIRCAGKMGSSAFEELVSAERIPMCIELNDPRLCFLSSSASSDPQHPQLLHAPLSATTPLPPPRFNELVPVDIAATVVAKFSHRALVRRGEVFRQVRWYDLHTISTACYYCGPSRSAVDHLHHVPQEVGGYLCFTGGSHIQFLDCGGISQINPHHHHRDRDDTTDDNDDQTGHNLITLTQRSSFSILNMDAIIKGYGCRKLELVNLAPFSHITRIGDRFMEGCTSLASIDLTPLTKVISIGNDFLCGCSLLQNVDLGVLFSSNITEIEDNFLAGCEGLKSVDLSGFVKVTTIGDRFMSQCVELTSINLSGFMNVVSVGDRFMAMCGQLPEINLRPLKSVTHLGGSFLYLCVGIQMINMSVLMSVPMQQKRAAIDLCMVPKVSHW